MLVNAIMVQARKEINFTDKYTKQNQGKYKIENNEVKELLQVMMAITTPPLPVTKQPWRLLQKKVSFFL